MMTAFDDKQDGETEKTAPGPGPISDGSESLSRWLQRRRVPTTTTGPYYIVASDAEVIGKESGIEKHAADEERLD